ncbi:MAG TPA: hypothetical protein VF796_27165 [Humisphaera sp.]
MRLLSLVLTVAAFVPAVARAADLKPDPARTFSARLQEGGHALAAELGHHGAWLIESPARLDALRATLGKHKAAVADTLGNVDFAKENLVAVYHYGDEGDRFVLKDVAAPPQAAAPFPNAQLDVDFGMSYVIYKQRRGLAVGVWQCFAVPVPKYHSTTVSVFTFHPMNGGQHPDLAAARPEWRWTISPQTGEACSGLAGTIAAQPNPPADDVLVKFTLAPATAARLVKDGQFAREPADPVHVWDGKYSNGYRNHAFEVVTPDGKTHLLRPQVQADWGKNAPHPVEVSAGKPYTLPNWVEGDGHKSLKALGLDLSQKGTYAITGIYQEAYEPQGKTPEMWGGVLRTNTIKVVR